METNSLFIHLEMENGASNFCLIYKFYQIGSKKTVVVIAHCVESLAVSEPEQLSH